MANSANPDGRGEVSADAADCADGGFDGEVGASAGEEIDCGDESDEVFGET